MTSHDKNIFEVNKEIVSKEEFILHHLEGIKKGLDKNRIIFICPDYLDIYVELYDDRLVILDYLANIGRKYISGFNWDGPDHSFNYVSNYEWGDYLRNKRVHVQKAIEVLKQEMKAKNPD